MTYLKSVVSKVTKAATIAAVAFTVVGCVGNPYDEDVSDRGGRNDVISIGDSIFDLNGVIQETLEANMGQEFRDYTQSGAEITGGLIATSVTNQYRDARATNPNINVVLADGGGNDILIPATLLDPYGCRTHWWRWWPSSSCYNLLEETVIHGINLMNEMDADGVQDVVWLGYYNLPRGNSNLNSILNTGGDWLAYACETATTASCSFIDTRGTVPANQVEGDDIHPTPAGSVNLAGQIWPVFSTKL